MTQMRRENHPSLFALLGIRESSPLRLSSSTRWRLPKSFYLERIPLLFKVPQAKMDVAKSVIIEILRRSYQVGKQQ
jgi:hypothetical protein